jgi:hypothetical protein
VQTAKVLKIYLSARIVRDKTTFIIGDHIFPNVISISGVISLKTTAIIIRNFGNSCSCCYEV